MSVCPHSIVEGLGSGGSFGSGGGLLGGCLTTGSGLTNPGSFGCGGPGAAFNGASHGICVSPVGGFALFPPSSGLGGSGGVGLGFVGAVFVRSCALVAVSLAST